ncbi:hypothetical protein Tco_0352361 [Tanacetum coccineum]
MRMIDFDLFSDQENSKEEKEETMAETMEQYMSKTRTDYGSGVARPKIDNKDQFELKGQFLNELRENTFSRSDNEDANENIDKVLEIVDLFHILNITENQLTLQVFPISLTVAASCWLRNEPTCSITTWEDLKTKFLKKYCPPSRTVKKMEEINSFQQEPDETLYQAWERLTLDEMSSTLFNRDTGGAIPTKTAKDAKKAIQEMAKYSQKWPNRTSRGKSTETFDGIAAIQAQLNNLGREIKKRRQSMEETLSKFMSESAKRHEENSNLIKEIQALTDAAIRNQGSSIKPLEILIGQISKPRQMTIPFPGHLEDHYCEEEGNYGPKFIEVYGALLINNTIPQK